MLSILKYAGVMLFGCLLWMGLSNSVQAGEGLKGGTSDQTNQSDPKKGGEADRLKSNQNQMKGSHSEVGSTIKGEVLRVEGDTYFLKGQDGKEVRLQTDISTQKTGIFKQGDRIEAKVTEENLALSIRPAQETEVDRGNKSGRIPDSTKGSGETSLPGR